MNEIFFDFLEKKFERKMRGKAFLNFSNPAKKNSPHNFMKNPLKQVNKRQVNQVETKLVIY
jgi:hypothetical protein